MLVGAGGAGGVSPRAFSYIAAAMEALLQYHEADQHYVLLAEEMERVLVVEMAALEVLAAEVVLTMEHSMQEVQTAEMDKVDASTDPYIGHGGSGQGRTTKAWGNGTIYSGGGGGGSEGMTTGGSEVLVVEALVVDTLMLVERVQP